jgi:hypothetical protein
VPPRADGVNATVAPKSIKVIAPSVGVPGRSGIFVVPAEASLNLSPANPEVLAFETAISIYPS